MSAAHELGGHWQPGGDYRIRCEDCPWLRVEQFRRNAHRTARAHANEAGHMVELRRQQYKTIRPEEAR